MHNCYEHVNIHGDNMCTCTRMGTWTGIYCYYVQVATNVNVNVKCKCTSTKYYIYLHILCTYIFTCTLIKCTQISVSTCKYIICIHLCYIILYMYMST